MRHWRRRRRTFLPALNADEYRKNPHRALTHIATVMSLVHCLGETVALAVGPPALRPVINRELALEDITEEGDRMRVPSWPGWSVISTAVIWAGAPNVSRTCRAVAATSRSRHGRRAKPAQGSAEKMRQPWAVARNAFGVPIASTRCHLPDALH